MYMIETRNPSGKDKTKAIRDFKGILAPSGMRRQEPGRRHFGNIHVRLEIGLKCLQPRFVIALVEYSSTSGC